MSFFDNLLGAASSITNKMRLRVTTDWSPPVELSLERNPDAPPNPLLGWLKPQVEVLGPDGRVLTTLAPSGAPEPPDGWGYVALAAGAVLIGLAVLIRRV